MRLPNGYGSCYKLPGTRRKPWVAAITTGYDEKGKRLFKVLGYYVDRVAANAALAEYHDCPVEAPKMTLEELYRDWSKRKYPTLAPKTVEGYKTAWNKIKPLWKMKVRDIKSEHMQRIIDRAVAEGLSYSTANNVRCIFSMLFEKAMERDIVKKDYSEYLEMPKKAESKKDRFTDLELAKIEQAARDGVPYADCILMLCYTGFRINEFLGLTRFAYNSEEGTLTGGIKTEAGKNRVIPVHPKIRPYLEKWLAKGGERIICHDNGRSFGDRSFRDDYYFPALKAIGVRELYPHECRHTFLSLLDNVDASRKTKATIAGHTQYETTEKNYIHKMISELREAVEQIP